jgi:hypothetical protein
MKINYFFLAGFVTSFIFAILVICLLSLVNNKGKIDKCKYDERQELIRGRGYKYSFFINMVLMVMYFALTQAVSSTDTFLEKYSSIILYSIIAIDATVHIVYCIWKDAYFPINKQPVKTLFLFILVALFNLLAFILNDKSVPFFCNLICFIMFSILFITLFIKRILDIKRSRL